MDLGKQAKRISADADDVLTMIQSKIDECDRRKNISPDFVLGWLTGILPFLLVMIFVNLVE